VPAVKGHRCCLASALSRVGPRILDCRLAAALRTTGKEKHASSCVRDRQTFKSKGHFRLQNSASVGYRGEDVSPGPGKSTFRQGKMMPARVHHAHPGFLGVWPGRLGPPQPRSRGPPSATICMGDGVVTFHESNPPRDALAQTAQHEYCRRVQRFLGTRAAESQYQENLGPDPRI
jgi:hypothetical protein